MRWIVSLAIIFSLSCQTNSYLEETSQRTSANLQGIVFDGGRQPLANAQVLLYDKNNSETSVQTDINGKFSFVNRDFGPYRLVVTKADHEVLETGIDFFSPEDLVYVRLYSQGQLLEAASDAIAQGEWAKAEDFLSRSQEVVEESVRWAYLKSILLNKQDEHQKALEVLSPLLAEERPQPYVLLLAADLLEYYLDDPTGAKVYLARFLELKYDADVQDRWEKL
jgi:hypothetical protein